jgi:hypothetical protein
MFASTFGPHSADSPENAEAKSEELALPRHRDTGTRRHRDAETRRHGDTGTRGHGDTGTWDTETWDTETREIDPNGITRAWCLRIFVVNLGSAKSSPQRAPKKPATRRSRAVGSSRWTVAANCPSPTFSCLRRTPSWSVLRRRPCPFWRTSSPCRRHARPS